MRLLVTGGAGFIGSAFCLRALADGHHLVVLDAMTYAASRHTRQILEQAQDMRFVKGDIRDRALLDGLLSRFVPDAVFHFAAETHVDRSIDVSDPFMAANISGTHCMLEATRHFWRAAGEPDRFRFFHISTDEVFGTIASPGLFDEDSPYAPRSPYAASKAASDQLALAWQTTYGLPVTVTNCSNNFGARQFPEKLIPKTVMAALRGLPIPIYGDGQHMRDWLHVDDHVEALMQLLHLDQCGPRYVIGTGQPVRNLDLAHRICGILDDLRPATAPHADLIRFVQDRPGHDARYAVDSTRLMRATGWRPRVALDDGLRDTVAWYIGDAEAGLSTWTLPQPTHGTGIALTG